MAIMEDGQKRHAGARAQYACAVAYCLMSLVFGIQLSICGPTASLLAAQTGVTEADLAPVLGSGGIGMIIGGLPSGWITDRFPAHHVLAISHFVQAIGFFLIPMCHSVMELALVYGTISLTFTMTNTALNCVAIWLLTPAPGQPDPPMTVAFLLNTISAMFGVGALAAPQIVIIMNYFTGSGINIFYVAVVMSITSIIAFVFLPPSPKPPAVDDDDESLTPSTPGSYAHSTTSQPRSPQQMIVAATGMPAPVLSRQNSRELSRQVSITGSRVTSRAASWAHGRNGSRGGACSHDGGLAAAVSARLQQRASDSQPSTQHVSLNPSVHSTQHDDSDTSSESEHMTRQKKYKVPFLIAALSLVFANISIELGFGNWIFTYCVRQADLTEDAGQQITSLFWLAFTLGRVPAMIMVQYISVSTIMAVTMPLAIVGALVPLVFEPVKGSGLAPPPGPPELLAVAGLDGAAAVVGVPEGRELTTLFVVAATILVACGSAAGTPCTLSLATEYITVDGFINGLIGTVAGIGATTFPYVVPVLAQAIPSLGFQCLMAATLVMAILQIASLVCMLSFGKAMGKLADFVEPPPEPPQQQPHPQSDHRHHQHEPFKRITELEEPLLQEQEATS